MHIVGGQFRRRPLRAPKGSTTRPTSSKLRETLFNILQDSIIETDFLDIFAGSGAVGLEALSRGARSCTFIENDREALRCLEDNIQTLKVAKDTQIFVGDFEKILKKIKEEGRQFDLIFADAPYHLKREGDSVSKILLEIISHSNLLKVYGRCFIENDQPDAIDVSHKKLILLNTRRSGKAFLHQYERTA